MQRAVTCPPPRTPPSTSTLHKDREQPSLPRIAHPATAVQKLDPSATTSGFQGVKPRHQRESHPYSAPTLPPATRKIVGPGLSSHARLVVVISFCAPAGRASMSALRRCGSSSPKMSSIR